MTDRPQIPSASAPAAAHDERTLPVIAYATYIAAPLTVALTAVIGVIIAHAGKAGASPMARSHYEFLIRTFWIGVAAFVASGVLFGLGAVLAIVLIGFPIMWLAGLLMAVVTIWFVVRSVAGLIYAVQKQPYPRPRAWLL